MPKILAFIGRNSTHSGKKLVILPDNVITHEQFIGEEKNDIALLRTETIPFGKKELCTCENGVLSSRLHSF